MRQDFRVKLDFSRIYLDARKSSWVYVDSTKICYVHQLAKHIKNLFEIDENFHLLSLYGEDYCFLPFKEDVRVLENNDTVLIVPGTGIETTLGSQKEQKPANEQSYELVEPEKLKVKDTTQNSEKSVGTSEITAVYESSMSDLTSVNGTIYKTAYFDSNFNNTNVKIPEDNITEDISMDNNTESSLVITNKRKRIRKRKQKQPTDILPERESHVETSEKKPRIIDSILINTAKHIRFQGLDENFESTSESDIHKQHSFPLPLQNGQSTEQEKKQYMPNPVDFSKLLTLRQQNSTPMMFTHKKVKKNSNVTNNSNLSNTKDNLNSIIENNDMISFKVLKINENYNPDISKMIYAKVINISEDNSQYTLEIIHGIEELKEPEGKFSLSNGESQYENIDDGNKIVTLDKSSLCELTKVTNVILKSSPV